LPYERQWNETAQVWEWVQAKPGADFGTGLSLDDTQTPPLVNLQPAGDSPATLGGVYVIDRERNVTEGLELGIDGRLRAPLATDNLAGTILEPPDDGKGYVRRREAGLSAWVPPSDTVYHFVLGLSFDETTRDVNLTPAGWSPDLLGGVYGEMRSATNGLDLSITGNGFITAPLATDLLAGTHTEPPPDGLAYSRQWDNVTDPANPAWVWVPALTAGLQITGLIPDKAIIGPTEPVVTVHAFGSQFTQTTVIVIDGTDATTTTYVSPTELTFPMNPAVPIGAVTHVITVRDTATAEVGLGAEAFEFTVSSTLVDYGLGLTLDTATTPNPTVNLDPAGDLPAELGGVWVPARNENQGLQLGAGGRLIVPKATDLLAGAITEPPPDDRQYARVRESLSGQSIWTAVMAAGVIISDTPPDVALTPPGTLWWESDSGDLFIMYDDGTSKQWVEAVAGADPGVKTHIGDAPPDPALVSVGDLWWDSDAGTLAIYYTDADSSQWVQIAGPMPPPAAGGGVEEAPVDTTPYVRQDATWVSATAAAANYGDLKHGFQANDHAGWIKLDGRAVTTLTATQQAQAALLGFTANLPLGDGAVFMQSAAALGTVGGGTLTQAMLPDIDLTAASAGNHRHKLRNRTGPLDKNFFGLFEQNDSAFQAEFMIGTSGTTGGSADLSGPMYDAGAHEHVVPLGGTGETIVPKNVSANAFIYLGA